MDFRFDHIGLANLFENGHNYLTFSIMGMMIVFAGLAFISIYILLLPKILNLPALIKEERKEKKEKITWNRREDSVSSWLTAGRMRGLAVRSHLPDRRS
jgi:Na+-transporting methylmalonyl-CoA/oxaloacetate decarboxylase gamma subunit